MRKLLLFLTLLLAVSFANAQYIYNDFDANQNEDFNGWPNVPVIVTNPDATGINTSVNVAQFDRTDWAQWDHAYTILSGKIDFTTGTVFSVKVYSPITCDVVFKLEDKTNGAIFVERPQSIGSSNEWVQLDFDFTGEASNTYDKIVIFFDFATFNANTFYFDDVEGPQYDDGSGEPVATLELPITFDVDTAQYDLIDFGGNLSEIIEDPDDSNNNIVKTIKQETAELWAGTTVGGTLGLATPLSFTPDSTVMSVRVWSPEIGIPVRLKAEDATNAGITVETEAVSTVSNDWETLSFNFANPAPGTPAINFANNYNKLSIFFNFGTTGADAGEQTYYWDDMDGVFPGPAPTIELPITFDVDTADYDLVDFGGNMTEIVEDPEDSENNVSETVKQETAETWAGTTVAGTLGLVQPLPFHPDSTHMSVRVWSPEAGIPVRLKAENASNGAITVETEVMTSIDMAWDTLIFNFGTPATGTPAIDFNSEYSKLSIFFNFGTTGADAGEQTYYWDDIEWIGALPPKPVLELNVQDNFEDDGWGTIEDWYFQDPDLVALTTSTDPEDQNNTVGDYNRSGGFQWTNAQFILDHRMDLSERNKFELDVYFPSSNDYSGDLANTAAIKLQNSLLGGNAWTTQTEIVLTVTEYDQWQTLLFDFSAIADSINYDQVIIQFGGEGHWAPGQFYFDNLYLKHVPYLAIMSPNGGEVIEQNSNFTIEWDYTYWESDIDIELIKEGNDPEPLALGAQASDSSFIWVVDYNQEPGEDYKIIITSVDDPTITDTSDAYFAILEVDGVQANFSADKTELPVGDAVTYTDLSSGDPDTWVWNFEGGTPETYEGQTPPAIVYNSEGVFDVTLTIYNGDEQDIILVEDLITVGLPPVANFEASETEIVGGDMIDFTNLSTGDGNTYEWVFEGGDPESSSDVSPMEIKYNEAGVFDVKLIVSNSFGEDTLIMNDYITVGTVGLFDNKENIVQVFPNPATNFIKIQLPDDGIYDINIQSINGQKSFELKNQNSLVEVNTSEYLSGIYFLSIYNKNTSLIANKKIIIQN